MGYTTEFLEKMFVGLRFKGDQDDYLYIYVTEGSSGPEFEEQDVEIVKIVGDVLYLIEYQVEDVEKPDEITLDHSFLPVDNIRDIAVNVPSETTLARWNSS